MMSGMIRQPNDHYGPSVDGYEYSRWGTYHRADHFGIGVDRTDKGTGYAQQYYQPNADMYNDPKTCPENLLLFFHHIPYDWKLKSGQTLILPDEKKKWAPVLYRIYLNLNLGRQFDEIDKLLNS